MAISEQSKREKYEKLKGFGLGTAILTATQLKQVYGLIVKAVGRLNDPTHEQLQRQFRERLTAAKINTENQIPIRAIANRSITDPKWALRGTLAEKITIEIVEEAISNCRPVTIQVPQRGVLREAGKKEDHKDVWPLQILFHNIAWYLAYESVSPGPGSNHLISVSRLDHLRLIKTDLKWPKPRQTTEMIRAQEKLHLLCSRSGGIYLGKNSDQQQEILFGLNASRLNPGPPLVTLKKEQLEALLKKGTMKKVGFQCTEKVFRFMREGLNRFPKEQIRLSGPRESDGWEPNVGFEQLQPMIGETDHPYPVEFILPAWTVDNERDFRRWLFGFGNEIVITGPEELRQEHQDYGAKIAALYADPPTPAAEAGASAAEAAG